MNVHTLRQSPLSRAIAPKVLNQVEQDMTSAGTLINHLHQRLGAQRTLEVWQNMAEASGRRFFPTPASLGPIDARLMTQEQALDYLALPHTRSFTTITLITPDPFAKLGDFAELKTHFGPFVPGGQATIRLEITTPSCFRELFDLIYPNAKTSYRDTADAAVLAALLPRRAWAEHRPTPEEEAQARATFLGLRFIDPQLEPPDAQATGEQPPSLYTNKRLYPHSRDEGGHLTVLGALVSDQKEEYQKLVRRVDNLSIALQQPLHLAVTSPRRLVALLKETQ